MKKLKENKILSLAIPATIENILQTLVGFIDTMMISRIGLLAVTAVGVANTILNVYVAVFIALGVGASALIAQYLGANKAKESQKITNQSVVLALVVGLIFSIVSLLFGKPLLATMGASDEVLVYSTQFFYIVGGTSVFISLMTVLGSILRATGDTKTPMKVTAIVNIGNIVLDYILIFGLGPIPALGVIGTAIGTAVSRLIGTILLLNKVQKSTSPIDFSTLFKKSNYKFLINLTIPATLERLVMRLGQVLYFGLIVSIGAKTFAAHSIAGNIESFTYMPAYGLATASATLVGNSIGAKDLSKASHYAYSAAKYGVISMSILGVILFFGSPLFATLFTNDSEAINQIVTALRIDSFAQPVLAISLITTGSLQGMGDTKSPLYSTAFGMWVIRVVGVIVLSKIFNLGIAGVWLSIAIDLSLRSLFLVYRFKKNIKTLDIEYQNS
ncbi:MATE family efflux transporter [Desemzia sp. C1]|uniref:MATE family efflux transporter n=1 Tax=Desemzia TaxID=82800 RepID=UPI001660B87C|nr:MULTISPECIES: MATE family efflux transporter [Desemzia]MCI3028302.1 MATE family efflux transporter [Desemzia sp. C1]